MVASIILYAAGSLRAALTDVARAYEAMTGTRVEGTFGPSGVLKNEIAAGARADVFASANREHPQALAAEGTSGPVLLFTRNSLCALVRPGLDVTSANLLETMLSPAIRLATSTPKADPSGDYAFAVFKKAERLRPGAQAVLEDKALLLTGAKDSAVPPSGENAYGWHIAQGRTDLFITYRTNAIAVGKQYPGQKSVMLPEALAVSADYGLTVMKDAPAGATAFAQFILSPYGQSLLAAHGFAPLPHSGDAS